MNSTTPLIVLVDIDRPLAQWDEGVAATARVLFPHLEIPDVNNRLNWGVFEHVDEEVRAALNHTMDTPDFYRNLLPQPGSVDALHEMLEDGIDVRLCSTPSLHNPTCASDKFAWVEEHYGMALARRTILTLDKTYTYGHFIIDDKDKMVGDVPPFWTQIVYDSSYNQETPGVRMVGWSDWRQALAEALGYEHVPGMRFAVGSPLAARELVSA